MEDIDKRGIARSLSTERDFVAIAHFEFGNRPASALAEGARITGTIEVVSNDKGELARALIVSEHAFHIVTVPPDVNLESAVGRVVTLEKTAGRVRVTPTVEPSRKSELECGR